MLDKLEAIKARFDDLGVALSNPEIVSDNRKFSAMSKEYRSLEKIVKAYGVCRDQSATSLRWLVFAPS